MRKTHKVLVAMSGGVDSTAAAILLKDKGYEIAGATMLLDGVMEKQISEAARIALMLGIEHTILDYRKLFKERIINSFVASYRRGMTPNPCVRCNEEIKFGRFLNDAEALGFSHMATGHYARTEMDAGLGKYVIRRGADKARDQTYFLYRLKQHQLSRILTPLAYCSKNEVRKLVRDFDPDVSEKADSQEICFIHDSDYREFIYRETREQFKQGFFIDTKGRILGVHKGVENYTAGQRKGLGIRHEKPLYVLSIEAAKNLVILGEHDECYGRSIYIEDISLVYADQINDGMTVECKVRSAAVPVKACLYDKGNCAEAVFEEPVWAPAPGQSAVFYENDTVFGGGIITGVRRHNDI